MDVSKGTYYNQIILFLQTTMNDISNLIYKFANSFDSKDWSAFEHLFTASVICDYTSSRKTYEVLTPEQYVAQRIEALNKLKTQHIFSNLEIYINDAHAICKCTALILRRLDNDFFNTHAIYEFAVQHINNQWRINRIKQQVLWHEGNENIHSVMAKIKPIA